MNNIYFSTNRGRLGNIIYWAACFYYCKQKYSNCNCFIEADSLIWYGCGNTNLYKYLSNYSFDTNEFPCDMTFEESNCEYPDQHIGEIINKINNEYGEKNIFFDNIFFQDSQYILSYKNSLKNIIYTYNESLNKYLDMISLFGVDNCLLMSVRHGEDYFDCNFYVLNKDYYIDMYNNHFHNIKNIFITSDDIEWCKENIKIPNVNFIYIDDLSSIEIITLGFYFKNYICANSTFSSCLELLSNYDDHKAVGVNNLFKYFRRLKLFSPNTIIYDIENEYQQYVENKNIFDII